MPIIGVIASSRLTTAPAVLAFDSIQTVTVGATQSTISFTSIPQTYKNLQIRISGGSVGGYAAYIRFNSDSGNNYSTHRISANNGVNVATGSRASYGGYQFGDYAGVILTTNACSNSILDIADYTLAKNKTIISTSGWSNNSTAYFDYESGAWYSTAAITRIDITMNTQNWNTNTVAALYGMK